MSGVLQLILGNKAASTNSAAYTNFIARTSGLDATHLNAYATLLNGLTTDGLFNSDGTSSYLDVLCIFATADTTTALLNLVSTSFNPTVGHATMTFSADHGYTGDATAGYINTNFTPSTAAGNYVQNSGHLGVYNLTSRTTNSAYQEIGCTGTFQVNLLTHWSDGKCYTDLNDTGGLFFNNISTANAQGHWIVTRTSSTVGNTYKNGSSIGTPGTVTSTGLPITSLPLFGYGVAGTSVSRWSGDQYSAYHIGAGLDSTKMTALSSRINAYMTTFGINVY